MSPNGLLLGLSEVSLSVLVSTNLDDFRVLLKRISWGLITSCVFLILLYFRPEFVRWFSNDHLVPTQVQILMLMS